MTDQLLSAEELSALAEGINDGSIPVDTGFNTAMRVRKHDLASEDSSLGVNVASIDMINERFVRTFRLGLLEMLRSSPRVSPNRVQISRFGDYLKGLRAPLSVNMVRMNPLRGYSIVAIDPVVVFSSLDSFFGGFGRGVTQLPPTRLFTPTETRIINMILEVFFRSLKDAWSAIMDIDHEVVSSEINPQFAQIADENDLVILSRFEVEAGPNTQGFIDLVYPYASLKPVRDLLRSRVQTGDGNEESDNQWRTDLGVAVDSASVEMRVMLGEIASSLGAIESMQPGDVLFFKKPDLARMLINDVPAFDVQVGNLGSQTAVQIQHSVIPGMQ
ncbi:MAG: flagellar motor switch protein FliM [Betaproteobacteria bacterium]